MDSFSFIRSAHVGAFAEKATIRPCALYPCIEPWKKHLPWASSGFTNASAPSFGGAFYPKRKGFQLLEQPFCHVSHILQAHHDDNDDVVVDIDNENEAVCNEAHMNSFDVLDKDRDKIELVNGDANDVVSVNSFYGENENKEKLPHGLHAALLPRHVAIIMDGNSRWAMQRGLRSSAGHAAGFEKLKLIVELSAKWGVQALTVFGFSTENWNRPKAEVSFLMQLFLKALREELPSLLRGNIVFRFIGNLKQLPRPLPSFIQEVEHKTSENSGLKLTVACNYSGRYDILQACQKVAKKVEQGKLRPEDIVESDIQQELGTSWMKEIENPDLLIRTSGELRISNFLLWQLAYSELYFMTEYWPEVNEISYADALLSYQKRNRRFGARPLINPDQ